MAHQPLGQATDQDLTSRRSLLEPLGGVDCIARGERRSLVARHDLAGVDPDPDAQLRCVAEGE